MAKKRKRISAQSPTNRQRALRKNIDRIFTNSGLAKIDTTGHVFSIGKRSQNELDSIFYSENIILLVEDTISTSIDHLRTKKETLQEILKNRSEFLTFLQNEFHFSVEEYPENRWKIFYVYICDGVVDVDPELYSPMKIVMRNALSYFVKMSALLHRSFKFELYRFLGLKREEIGDLSASQTKNPPLPIVYPTQTSGLPQDVSIVSFMLSAECLIQNGYVLRKDNWEESAGLYQRLLIPSKLKSIRKFVYDNRQTFFNNIIVSLPNNAEIRNEEGKKICSHELDNFCSCTLHLPDEFNSICIIDGQHRVYAYFEDDPIDAQEIVIKTLRKRMHLLVTGILFPEDWSPQKRRSFESDLFLNINRNSKTVSKDITLHIEAQKEPYARNSIARSVLVKMNKNGVFANHFQISLLETDKIKISSIIQYALGRLVSPSVAENGLYRAWKLSLNSDAIPDNLQASNDGDGKLLEKYIQFCAQSLNIYFGAIRSAYLAEWSNPKSKITRVFAINAFIIALHRSLPDLGMKGFNFYQQAFEAGTRINFENPGYAGSQYARFAIEVLLPILLEKNNAGNDAL